MGANAVPGRYRLGYAGFTLVELVMVLIIVGILSVGAIGLFSTRGDFAARLVSEQAVSSARLAQQVSLARHDGDTTSLVIAENSVNVVFTVSHGSEISQSLADKTNVTVNWSTSTTNTCTGVTGTLPYTLSFDKDGDTGQKTLLCIDGKKLYPVCIASTGFAYAGTCSS